MSINFSQTCLIDIRAPGRPVFCLQFYGLGFRDVTDAVLLEITDVALTRRGIDPSACTYGTPRPAPVKARNNIKRLYS